MLIDITGSALISGKVAALPLEKRTAQHDLAEALLSLSAAFVERLSSEQMARVKMAVVLQLNFQVEQGLDPFIVQSQSAAAQGEARTYRDNAMHPQAIAIVQAIEFSDDSSTQMVQRFANIPGTRSMRTQGSGGNPSTPYRP